MKMIGSTTIAAVAAGITAIKRFQNITKTAGSTSHSTAVCARSINL